MNREIPYKNTLTDLIDDKTYGRFDKRKEPIIFKNVNI